MSGNNKGRLDLVSIRTKAEAAAQDQFWRSLGEVAQTEGYQHFAKKEFSEPESKRGVNRRDALKLMGASAALAGLAACTKMPSERIVPYVNAPEEFEPGKPLFFATTMPWQGVGQGVLAWSFMGRPTKVEGNTDHPGSRGKANIFMQASVLDLYDPDRSQVTLKNGYVASWSDFLVRIDQLRAQHLRNKGEGLRILTGTVTSPTLADQLQDLLKQFPQAQWHQYEPVHRDNSREGSRLAFGQYMETVYRLDQADVIVSIDSDLLFTHPGGVRYAFDFANKRRVADPQSPMNRLYAVEPTPTITGTQADHRVRLKPSQVDAFARALAAELGVSAQGLGSPSVDLPQGWMASLVRDLQSHRGSSLIVAGESQSPAIHALAHAMNAALGNIGKTVYTTQSIEANPVNQTQSFQSLVSDMEAGKVETLLIFANNPAFSSPVDVDFAGAVGKVHDRFYLGLYEDETSVLCNWHIPAAHYLESWGDARAYDGTVSTMQPLIAPLYDGKSAYEILTLFQGQPGRTGHTVVRDYWQGQNKKLSASDFEVEWETWLEKGVIDGTAFPEKPAAVSKSLSVGDPPAESGSGGIEIGFIPDPSVWDGMVGNNGWLQELPKPFNKMTWDNVVMLSPATAQRLGVTMDPSSSIKGEVLELKVDGHVVQGPAFITPGQADDCLVVTLGYGRVRAGRVGTGRGFNTYAIRTADKPWTAAGLQVKKTGKLYRLATTQLHFPMIKNEVEPGGESGAAFRRNVVRVATMTEFQKDEDFAKDPPDMTTQAQTLYPALPAPYDFKKGPQWGMSIDLTSCIGCNACLVACQAENNIAVVGKDQTSRGRIMHWLRVDTYYRGSMDDPEIYNEVVPCMQCENAPCEYVCPVGATVTGPEGINEQIYNRCVGTRYCSNNCPYKVRRFNFYLYSDWNTPSLYPLANPRVTVRSRGVMEKCTYCIQRIRYHEIYAEEAGRPLRDGEILTACQQTCPTNAIVFGDIKDAKSQVSLLKGHPHNFGLLEELNTRPRTTYLAKIVNTNPEIKKEL